MKVTMFESSECVRVSWPFDQLLKQHQFLFFSTLYILLHTFFTPARVRDIVVSFYSNIFYTD